MEPWDCRKLLCFVHLHKMQTCYLKNDPALKLCCFKRHLESEMRDMTLKFKRDLSVSNRGKLCI